MIYNGDCINVMKEHIADCSIQTCVTSPPYYGLRDYGIEGQFGGEESPEKYVENMVRVFAEVRRCLREDGTLWLNLGDSYYNYRPGKGQALVKQSVSTNKQDLPDSCARRGTKLLGLKEKDLIGIPWRVAFALQADGWYLRQDIIWSKPNPMPESVGDRCTKSHEYIFLMTKNKDYYYDSDAIKEPSVNAGKIISLGAKSFAKGQAKGAGVAASGNGLKDTYEVKETRNKRSVWTVTTKPYKGAHFATFPMDLIEPCILAGSKNGDMVLDPFNGSGTTGAVAYTHNREYIGIELNPAYIKLSEDRLKNVQMEALC